MITDSRETEKLLTNWIAMRQQLEVAADPFTTATEFFDRLPKAKHYTDPYDPSRWPTPWELILENTYCPFNMLLGICYSFQLTERFQLCQPSIRISIDIASKTVYYLLVIGEKVYGYDEGWVRLIDLPKSLKTQKIFEMEELH